VTIAARADTGSIRRAPQGVQPRALALARTWPATGRHLPRPSVPVAVARRQRSSRRLGPAVRLSVARRVPFSSGTHVPHPGWHAFEGRAWRVLVRSGAMVFVTGLSVSPVAGLRGPPRGARLP